MEAKLQKLESTLDEVKASLQEIKLENSSVRKQVEGKKVLHVTNGESSDDLAEKSLRDLVEEISSEVKNISHHVQGNNNYGLAPAITDSVSYGLGIGAGLQNAIVACSAVATPFAPLPEADVEELPTNVPLFVPIPSPADNEVDNQVLQLQGADLNIEDNGKQHHTNEYSVMLKESPQLVVRRGQEFTLRLDFSDRTYVKDADVIRLTFYLADNKPKKKANKSVRLMYTQNGKRYSSNQDSAVVVYVGDESTNGWAGLAGEVDDKGVTIKVIASPSCPVGKWMLEVELSSKLEKGSARPYEFTRPLYIIFNPWCELDDTYYPNEKQQDLETYVLGTAGPIYRNNMDPINWHFDQFDENILDCALLLFNHIRHAEHPLTSSERSNVVTVVRRLTSVVNSYDKTTGVLVGNWEEVTPEDGNPPGSWSGSKDILKQYFRHKRPVKYGQCWVFAGVLTTVCRTLGIPCRVVTNYASFHELGSEKGGYSFTMDTYCDAKGKPLPHHPGTSKKSWNFHVWNEAWMRRTDLPEPYSASGWQAIDATPQEASVNYYEEGNYTTGGYIPVRKMGPAPVAACKAGDVHINYDVGFVFGEVNADKVFWRCHESSHPPLDRNCERIEPIKIRSTDSIGKDISTEKPGDKYAWYHEKKRNDVTLEYKYKEGTKEERESMRNALRNSNSDYSRVLETNEIKSDISIKATSSETSIGSPIKFQVVVKNEGKQRRNGSAWVQVYSDAPRNKRSFITEFSFEFDLEPEKDVVKDYTIESEEYINHLQGNKMIQVDYTAAVDNTDIAHFGKSYFKMIKPNMTLSVPDGGVYVNRGFEVTIQLTNQSHDTLKKGMFTIQATGCNTPEPQELLRLGPHKETSVRFELVPTRAGKVSISANFVSHTSHHFESHASANVNVINM